jgi:hypothetical protein
MFADWVFSSCDMPHLLRTCLSGMYNEAYVIIILDYFFEVFLRDDIV